MQDLRARFKKVTSLNKKNFQGGGLFLIFALVLSGCGRTAAAQSEFVLGTVCTINLYDKGTAPVYRTLFARLREIEGIMSANRAGSDLDLVNQHAGFMPVPVRPELIAVLSRALHFAELSGGAFDPTIGPLVKLWGIGTDAARVPAGEEIRAALEKVNWREVAIDEKAGTVYLKRPGMALDLGGIAKGYAADAVAALIREAALPRAVIDLGGNIFALGEKTAGKPGAPGLPWRIALQNPREPRGKYIGVLEVRDKTVVTSGVYERFLETGGKRYHHILSTADGYPADTGLLSVSVIAERSMDADALSTALFALGYEKGRALAESLEGVEAVFVFEDLGIAATREGLLQSVEPSVRKGALLDPDQFHFKDQEGISRDDASGSLFAVGQFRGDNHPAFLPDPHVQDRFFPAGDDLPRAGLEFQGSAVHFRGVKNLPGKEHPGILHRYGSAGRGLGTHPVLQNRVPQARRGKEGVGILPVNLGYIRRPFFLCLEGRLFHRLI